MHIFTEAARGKHAINPAKKKKVTERKRKQRMRGLEYRKKIKTASDNDYHWKNISQAWKIKDCEYTKA